jgi:hypothetical protein
MYYTAHFLRILINCVLNACLDKMVKIRCDIARKLSKGKRVDEIESI